VARSRLIVLLRLPLLGQVKSRLAAGLGSEQALSAYRHLLAATLDSVRELESVELRHTPDDGLLDAALPLRADWQTTGQGPGDLGTRMNRAFEEGFSLGFDRLVVIGTDCPYLTADDIRAAWKALETHDLVLGPATDGGYWLVGLRRSQPELFCDMAWGSASVCLETRRRAANLGLRSHLLRELPDVDTPADWGAYQSYRNANPSTSPLFASGPAADNLPFR